MNSERSVDDALHPRASAPVTGDDCRFGSLVGGAACMRAVYQQIEKVAPLDVPVLLTGETGTGKELVAREIQARSRRSKSPFVSVNTGALSRELVASELFGHQKGAFTGALLPRTGRFLEANSGSLFLDEINATDAKVQVALLRVLESGKVRPIGAMADRDVDVRVLAASNANLELEAARGGFRIDLLHRLQVFQIDVPPLRERVEDIEMLATVFIKAFNRRFGLEVLGLDPQALRKLREYPWPGNVRELKNAVAQAVVMAHKGAIRVEHLPMRIGGAAESGLLAPTGRERLESAIRAKEDAAGPADGPDGDAGPAEQRGEEWVVIPLGEHMERLEQLYVEKTLRVTRNNKTRAASMLGISRKALYDKLNRWERKKKGLRPLREQLKSPPAAD